MPAARSSRARRSRRAARRSPPSAAPRPTRKGVYRLTALPAGTYTVTVTATGLATSAATLERDAQSRRHLRRDAAGRRRHGDRRREHAGAGSLDLRDGRDDHAPRDHRIAGQRPELSRPVATRARRGHQPPGRSEQRPVQSGAGRAQRQQQFPDRRTVEQGHRQRRTGAAVQPGNDRRVPGADERLQGRVRAGLGRDRQRHHQERGQSVQRRRLAVFQRRRARYVELAGRRRERSRCRFAATTRAWRSAVRWSRTRCSSSARRSTSARSASWISSIRIPATRSSTSCCATQEAPYRCSDAALRDARVREVRRARRPASVVAAGELHRRRRPGVSCRSRRPTACPRRATTPTPRRLLVGVRRHGVAGRSGQPLCRDAARRDPAREQRDASVTDGFHRVNALQSL